MAGLFGVLGGDQGNSGVLHEVGGDARHNVEGVIAHMPSQADYESARLLGGAVRAKPALLALLGPVSRAEYHGEEVAD